MNEKEAIEQLKNILKNTENILKPLDEETPEEVKAFQKMQFKNYNAIKTVLNLLEKKDKQIEYYKNQKRYDEQFKHELLEKIRCKSLTIDSLNKILDDRLICIQGGRGLYTKLKGLDKEYLIREYLSMYKTCKQELKKKDKQIDEMAKKINEAYFESGDFEEWFENKICKVQKYEDYTYLEKDIKQHFERKVEDGN